MPVRVVGVNVDVTERKRDLVELRNFTETLEEAVKERTRELEAENEARKQGRGVASPGAENGSRRPAHRRRRA